MSKETATHISGSDALCATISGALLGAGLFVPPLGGLGLTASAIGFLRVRSREQERQLKVLSRYLSNSVNDSEMQKRSFSRKNEDQKYQISNHIIKK